MEKFTSIALLTLLFIAAQSAYAETAILKSSEMRKATDHVFFGIMSKGPTILSFDKLDDKSDNGLVGFSQVTVGTKES